MPIASPSALCSWNSVLADRDDVASRLREVAQRVGHLLGALAHAEDEIGFRDLLLAQARHDPERLERPVVVEGRPDSRVQASHGLEVMREHVRPGVDHGGDVLPASLEVGGKDLDPAPGDGVTHGPD